MKSKTFGKNCFALFLAFLLLLVPLTSCNKKGKTKPDSGNETEPTGSETDGKNEFDPLADELGTYDFENRTFNILSRGSSSYEFDATELKNDVINDAVYMRNIAVEDRFHCNINVETVAGDWKNRTEFMNYVMNAYQNMPGSFDLVSSHASVMMALALQGCAYDLTELENLNLAKRWWCQQYYETGQINGKLLVAVGDINITLYKYMMVCFVNLNQLSTNGINDYFAETFDAENIFDMVRDKKWTLEAVNHIAQNIGNGTDRYSIIGNNHAMRSFLTSWDIPVTSLNSQGYPQLNISGNHRLLDAYDKLYKLMCDTESASYNNDYSGITKLFANGKSALLLHQLDAAQVLRSTMDEDYAIVPYPMYDTDQTDYRTSYRDAMSVIMVLRNVSNPLFSGTVTEALSMYGRQEIVLPYYDTILKYQYFNTSDMPEMLDIIRNSLAVDFGIICNYSLGGLWSIFSDNIGSGSSSLTSYLETNEPIWKNNLDTINARYARY